MSNVEIKPSIPPKLDFSKNKTIDCEVAFQVLEKNILGNIKQKEDFILCASEIEASFCQKTFPTGDICNILDNNLPLKDAKV